MGTNRPCRGRSNLFLASGLATAGCALDLVSKQLVFGRLGPPQIGNVYWIWPEYFGLETSINTGALFGIGQGGVQILAGISFVAVAGVIGWLTMGQGSRDRWLSVTLGLILGGILGNLYDRLGLWGQRGVRDWILFRYEQFVWPNFNIADCLLVCGAAMMMWHAIRQEWKHKGQDKPAATAESTVTSHVG